MKKYTFLFFIKHFLLIIFNIFSLSSSKTSSIIPLYKIILTENLSHLEINYLYNFRLNVKGNGIIFNDNSDFSIMPMYIFEEIYKFYRGNYDDIIINIEKLENDYSELTMVSSLYHLETLHFIFREMGITIPLEQLFVLKDEENHLYSFRFFSKENVENIIFGKDLIELMDINFYDNNQNFKINNEEYISKIEND